jgi:hypothetical protein
MGGEKRVWLQTNHLVKQNTKSPPIDRLGVAMAG